MKARRILRMNGSINPINCNSLHSFLRDQLRFRSEDISKAAANTAEHIHWQITSLIMVPNIKMAMIKYDEK